MRWPGMSVRRLSWSAIGVPSLTGARGLRAPLIVCTLTNNRQYADYLAGRQARPPKHEAEEKMPQHPEDLIADKKRPFTGAEYLQSLRDGREVYIYGERIKDVTAHPAF